MRNANLWRIIHSLSLLIGRQNSTPEQKRAKQRIEAIDKGGIPTIPSRVNSIAQELGLTVRSSDPIEVTVARIRKTIGKP
jgi:hypothetical protein